MWNISRILVDRTFSYTGKWFQLRNERGCYIYGVGHPRTGMHGGKEKKKKKNTMPHRKRKYIQHPIQSIRTSDLRASEYDNRRYTVWGFFFYGIWESMRYRKSWIYLTDRSFRVYDPAPGPVPGPWFYDSLNNYEHEGVGETYRTITADLSEFLMVYVGTELSVTQCWVIRYPWFLTFPPEVYLTVPSFECVGLLNWPLFYRAC